jgi:hypothetical protein
MGVKIRPILYCKRLLLMTCLIIKMRSITADVLMLCLIYIMLLCAWYMAHCACRLASAAPL